jgi:hypothetical protein
MSIAKCVVRLRDDLEIRHRVVVYAGSLYEAVLRGLNQLSGVGWESHAEETIKYVEVEIYQEPTRHVVDVPKLLEWIKRDTWRPGEQTKKEKLRRLLGMRWGLLVPNLLLTSRLAAIVLRLRTEPALQRA